MKTILFPTMIVMAIAAGEASTSVQKQESESYCMESRAGKNVVMYKNKPLTHEVDLDNGSRLKADGTVVKKNGDTRLLKPGECMSPSGKITGPK